MSLRFKIDENLPVEIANLLEQKEYPAESVYDENLQGTADCDLFSVCVEEKRILVTLDHDFSNIKAYPPTKSPGIIVLKLKSQSKPHIIQKMKEIIPNFKNKPVINSLWIVDETKIRIHNG